MERNTETLNPRDLASPNEPRADVRTSEGDVGDAPAADGHAGLHDPAAPAEKPTQLRADEETQLPADERIRAATDEQTRLSAEQTARPDDVLTGASTSNQTVEAGSPNAAVGIESGAGGDEAKDWSAQSTQAGSSPDQETEAAPASTGTATLASDPGGSLLPADMDATFQQRWKEIQTRFVDQPREAVEDADSLVANLMQQLADGFAKERERLEAQWGRGEDISTEDLRVALQRYRTFFQRLLST